MLKRLVLGFWAVWLTVVTTTNLLDAVKALGNLPPGWPIASGNYRLLVEATAIYRPAPWVNGVLFGGVIVWEAVAAALFWRAGVLHGKPGEVESRNAAFTVSLGLWMAFLLADEILINYSLAGTHSRLLTAHLASLLVVALVPETPRLGEERLRQSADST